MQTLCFGLGGLGRVTQIALGARPKTKSFWSGDQEVLTLL